MTNKQLANKFSLYANLMELHGESDFRVKSYQSTYRTIRNVEGTIVEKSAEALAAIPRVGKSTIEKIEQIKASGSFTELDEIISKTPIGIVELLGIKGLGAKKIKAVWKELEITTPGELLYACKENRLVDLKGFGEKTQIKIQEQLSYFLESKGKVLYGHFESKAIALKEELSAIQGIDRIEFTGEFRRKMPIINCLQFLLIGEDNPDFYTALGAIEGIEQKEDHYYYESLQLDFLFVEEDAFALEWLISSSDENFLQEYGIEDQMLASEEEIFDDVGAAFVIPEMRDGRYTIDELDEFNVDDLVERKSLKGVVHNHSTYSDGTHTLEEMTLAAKNLGYEYMVISDHSKAAFYANGLDESRLITQAEEVKQLNLKYPDFKLFHGIEADILYDGRLDYNDEIVSSLDVVIASIHSTLSMDIDKATSRLISAVENPHTDILGHPTGRLLLSRKGYPIDHAKVIDACAANGVAIELNANPYRLDLDWEWIIYALQAGVYISINPDAHSIEGLEDVHYGIHTARKAGLTVQECLNAMNLADFEAWLKERN